MLSISENPQMHDRLGLVEGFCAEWLESFSARNPAEVELLQSLRYSLQSGGKRIRPLTGLLAAEQMGVAPQKVLPWVFAVELIHTYSLIHDDLPCMDNDDFRRGRPTNHKVYGEACALLAGDVLLTEAFGLVARSFQEDPSFALRAVEILSRGAGFAGMAGGQAIDLLAKRENFSEDEIIFLHRRKTGALFEVVCHGVAVLSGGTGRVTEGLRQFGAELGLCFQMADDLIDSRDQIEAGSLPALLGLERTRRLLEEHSRRALEVLAHLDIKTGPLVDLIQWNLHREK